MPRRADCSFFRTVASLGLYLEGFTLLKDKDLERMAKGIRYRFGRWGFTPTQMGSLTAFINPKRDDDFDERDWNALVTPLAGGKPLPISNCETMIRSAYSNPSENDGRFYLWFDAGEMAKVKVSTEMLNKLGTYTSTTRLDGVGFYFTGIPNVHRCATQGICLIPTPVP